MPAADVSYNDAEEAFTMADHMRLGKPRNNPIPETQQLSLSPHISTGTIALQSSRCKPSSGESPRVPNSSRSGGGGSSRGCTSMKKNITSAALRGLGCTASPQVSVPAAIRASADWQAKKSRKKKRLHHKKGAIGEENPSSSSTASVAAVPDIWCGPGIGFAADAAASVDCVVSARRPLPGSARAKIDAERVTQRERSSGTTMRRASNPEHISLLDSDSDVFGARYYRNIRHHSPEGLAEIMLFQSGLPMGGRLDLRDRYRGWRLDVDNMSYEDLLELGDQIGYVNTGLREDEIRRSIRKSKFPILDHLSSHSLTEIESKCSICQEEFEEDDEMGKLECGHGYHTTCIKQWLAQKNTCPVCKSAATA